MTRPIDRHLDRRELGVLAASSGSGAPRAGNTTDSAIAGARQHLESCPDCREQVEMYEYLQGKLGGQASPGEVIAGPDCVDEQEWLNVAGALVSPEKSQALVRHAAQCSYCGPLLRQAVETLAEASSPEEEGLMAALESSGGGWQEQLSRRLAEASPARPAVRRPWWRPRPQFLPRMAFAMGVVALLVAAAWVTLELRHKPSVDQLLAQAYTERRTIEPRIPGANYAPLRVERGTASSELDKPRPLLKAEALLSDALTSNPNDPTLLQAKALADLLDGNSDAAIESLQRAMETRPESADLVADLGVAYYLRASATDRPLDYGYALDALAKALEKKPDDPVVLFNHALASEHLFLYTEAKEDWTRYLQLDPRGGWADEARKHLADVEKKIEQQLHNQTEPLLSPEQIASAQIQNPEVRDQIDLRAEQYLRAAITNWLPSAFPVTSSGENSGAAKGAILLLADILRQKHNDPWLHDLMIDSSSEEFPVAIHELSAALQADERGDYAAAQTSAVRAVRLFDEAHNSAGEMRATAEAIYSDQLLWEGKRCFTRLEKMREPLARSSYGWLRGQMLLEESNCANLVGDLGTYQTAIVEGVREAQLHNYTPLYLRGLGFEALSAASFGDEASDFKLATQGLVLYWSHPVDIMKGYNLYYDLDSAADTLQLRNLQIALWREAIVLIDRHPDVLQRAMAHRWSGKAALSAGKPRLAATEFAESSSLFAASPHTTATARDLMDAEVWLANAELQQGDIESAEKRLAALKPSLDAAPSFDPEIGYYSAEADIALKLGDSARVEAALRPAIFLSEWALHSLDSEAGRREWAEQTRTAYCDAIRWKLHQGDPKSALELWEWYRAADLRSSDGQPGSASTGSHQPIPPRLQDAEALPSPLEVTRDLATTQNRTVAAYAVFADGIALWSYDDRGINFHWITISADRVTTLAARLSRLCADPNSDLVALRASARELYDVLIAPLEAQLTSGRIIVFEPDDLLSSVPWEALIDRQGNYLLERAPIVVAPGLYQTRRLRTSLPINEKSPALIVAVPSVPSESLPPLIDASEEASAVARYFHAPREFQGNAATLKMIREQITGAEIFHFAGHAVRSPQRSGLLLSELDPHSQRAQILSAGTFAPGEIRKLQLAVLSACGTAAGSQANESATQSLAEYLLSSGVPHVIASRWNVDSHETAEFMSDFYAKLFQGKSVADAIYSARLTLASRPASRHPYYWAAFELQGAA